LPNARRSRGEAGLPTLSTKTVRLYRSAGNPAEPGSSALPAEHFQTHIKLWAYG